MINQERWFKFDLCEQMGHIGSEIARARVWDDQHESISRNKCLERALELIDITKDDQRLYKRRRELCYLREVVADHYGDTSIFSISLKDLEHYCFDFALIARKNN